MTKINYSKEELEKLNKDQLKRLCVFFDIEVFPQWGRPRMIKELLKYVGKIEIIDFDYDESESPAPAPLIKSVRVQRIEDQMKGN